MGLRATAPAIALALIAVVTAASSGVGRLDRTLVDVDEKGKFPLLAALAWPLADVGSQFGC